MAPVKFSTGGQYGNINAALANPGFYNEPLALASMYSFLKLLISLIQATWAIITLYRARGNQIDEYRYAAFGLTVAPYA